MATPTRETITREEFDRRLDALNERRQDELQHHAEEQAQIEGVLANYENVLDEVEVELGSQDEPDCYPARLRKSLEELAKRTTELATSL